MAPTRSPAAGLLLLLCSLACVRSSPRCEAPGAWRNVSAEDGAECNIEQMSRLLAHTFRSLGNQTAAPAGSSSHVMRLLEELSGLDGDAKRIAPRRRLRGLPGGSRPLAPGEHSPLPMTDPRNAAHASAPHADGFISWESDHAAREQDATLYGTYRVACAFWRHFSEVMLVPEGLIGIVFGFWWMNMMTMKTCFICGNGIPRASKEKEEEKGCPTD